MDGNVETGGVPAALAPADVEARVLAHVAELLQLEQVSPDDDFLSIGGNSLTAVLLLERLEQDFGVSLPIVAVFDALSLRAIVDLVRGG